MNRKEIVILIEYYWDEEEYKWIVNDYTILIGTFEEIQKFLYEDDGEEGNNGGVYGRGSTIPVETKYEHHKIISGETIPHDEYAIKSGIPVYIRFF